MELTDLPWVAVLVGAAAAFALGALWFSPLLFGKRWAALTYPGKSLEEIQAGGSKLPYLVVAVAWLVAAATLGWFAAATGLAGDPLGSLRVGLYAGLGVVAASFATTYAFAGKTIPLFLIDAGYQASGLALIGLSIGLLG